MKHVHCRFNVEPAVDAVGWEEWEKEKIQCTAAAATYLNHPDIQEDLDRCVGSLVKYSPKGRVIQMKNPGLLRRSSIRNGDF